MATNSFKIGLKHNQNSVRIEKELRLLEIATPESKLSDSLYRQMFKISPRTAINLDFFAPVQWHSSRLASLDNVVVMFMMDDVKKILSDSHKIMRSIRTRLPLIKNKLAEEYQLGMTLLSIPARKVLNTNAVKHMSLQFIVFSTQYTAVLWIKSDMHGSEYLKVSFDGKTNKLNFDL